MHKLSRSEAAAVPTCDCETDPIACLEQMFVEMVQLGRIKKGQDPARRPVFVRTHGVAYGRFEIVPGLEERLRVGLFAQRAAYPAWVRFSSDPFGMPDYKSTVGIGIKLFHVEGEKVLPPDEHAVTADFLLQNMDVFFVDNAHDMCAFTKASLTSSAAADAWLKDHPTTQQILDEMEKVVPTVLGTDLWSVIPFHLGENHFCKYKLEPALIPDGPAPDYDDPNYLHADLAARLKGGEARFHFMVQLQTNPKTMPLDKATVRWSEKTSPPIHVATLILPAQDITARSQTEYGEALSFNPWRTLKAHEPVGSIAEARKIVYRASATLRRNVNGQPIGEPQQDRPSTSWPAGKDSVVVRAAIHPGIGVARIGNSTAQGEAGYYIGPEVVEPPPTPTGATRDPTGAIKRQAARFRIYGYNAAGEVVSELTSDNARITWTVHLANKKAAWYRFLAALDIPEASSLSVPRRNTMIKGANRSSLIIDPGPRAIEGKNTTGPAYQFDTGSFMGVQVHLGEIRTDDSGQLLVLGGHGNSGSPEGKPVYNPADLDSFNNADGWFDDISDGPVTARVAIGGQALPVDPAWVVVAPPNFAPDVVDWRTLYDQLADTYVQCGWMPFPETVSFTRDVLPVLRRLSNLQWVNKGFATMFGRGCPMDFENPEFIGRLAFKPASASDLDPYAELRQQVFNLFRPADNNVNDPRTWPWIYGDAFGSFDTSPRNNLALSDIRTKLMERWVAGDFVSDWTPDAQPYRTLKDVPLQEQPAMLDQAALHFCLADAFHPGCEMTWPMRHPTLYMAPFRIRHRPADAPEPDHGDKLTQEIVLQPGGPLYAQGPGDLSRWMALPWQGDTAFCRSGYDADYDPYLPTFWPARVPNQILTAEDYVRVMDESLPREERIAAYNNREQWLRALSGPAPQQMMQMIANFGKMGIVEARPGIENDPDFPEVMLVESLPEEVARDLAHKAAMRLAAPAPAARPRRRSRLEQAGWESVEQLEEFRKLQRW